MYGSLQGLLNSFSSKVPEKGTCGLFGYQNNQPVNNSNGYYYQDSGLEHIGNGKKDTELPAIIDESGYESSESSVYDVVSEDEEYHNNTECLPLHQNDVSDNHLDAQ
jgi:hypothetical protein